MSIKQCVVRSTVAAAALVAAGAVHAVASVDVGLAGWESHGGFNHPDNSFAWVDLGAGSTVLGFEYIGLSFTTHNGSWLNEFGLSVENDGGWAGGYLDLYPSATAAAGTFGPASGAWGGSGSFGAPFTTSTGLVKVLAFEEWDDDGLDAVVGAGMLRIIYEPIPEPATYGLMALGLLGVGAVVRRRKR